MTEASPRTDHSTADAIVVGAGLAGLVATAELAAAGKRVILVEQEPEQSLGGQAFWSFGGLFLVNSPEQRRLRDQGLARARLAGLARHGRVRPARGRVAAPLGRGVRRLGRGREARRGCTRRASASSRTSAGQSAAATLANGPGNSVPRFHVTWGTGPGLIEPFVARRPRGTAQRARRAALPPSRRPA